MPKSNEERLQHLLADIYRVRIVDVHQIDIDRFLVYLRKHGLMLISETTVIK